MMDLSEESSHYYFIPFDLFLECNDITFYELLDHIVMVCEVNEVLGFFWLNSHLDGQNFELNYRMDIKYDYTIKIDYSNKMLLVITQTGLTIIRIEDRFMLINPKEIREENALMLSLLENEIIGSFADHGFSNIDSNSIIFVFKFKKEGQSDQFVHVNQEENFRLNFEKKQGLITTSLFKGNLLDISLTYKEPDSNNTIVLSTKNVVKSFSFRFDSIKRLFAFTTKDIAKINSYEELAKIDFSFFLVNKENLIYMKKVTHNSNTMRDEESIDSISVTVKKRIYRNQNDEIITKCIESDMKKDNELSDLSIILKCEINNKYYLPNGMLFECIMKQQDSFNNTTEHEYYFCLYDQAKCIKFGSLDKCQRVFFINEFDLIICFKRLHIEFNRFDRLTNQLFFLNRDVLINDYSKDLKDCSIYVSDYNSNIVVFYKMNKQEKDEGLDDKETRKTLLIYFFKVNISKKYQLVFNSFQSLDVKKKPIHFFYEDNKIILVDEAGINVFFWKESMKETLFLKYNNYDFGTNSFRLIDKKPVYLFYENNIFIEKIGRTNYDNDCLIFLAEWKGDYGLLVYNLHTSAIDSFDHFIRITTREFFEKYIKSIETFDILNNDVVFRDRFFYRGVSFIVKASKELFSQKMKDHYFESHQLFESYTLLVYFPQKQNIEIDFTSLKKKKYMNTSFIIKSPFINSTEKKKEYKMLNNISYQNEINVKQNEAELELVEENNDRLVYKIDINKIFHGNYFEERLILSFMADNFGTVVQLRSSVYLEEDHYFSDSIASFFTKIKPSDIIISFFNDKTYLMLTKDLVVHMDMERYVSSHIVNDAFIFTTENRLKTKDRLCTREIIPNTDLFLFKCRNHAKEKSTNLMIVLSIKNLSKISTHNMEYFSKFVVNNDKESDIKRDRVVMYKKEKKGKLHLLTDVNMFIYDVEKYEQSLNMSIKDIKTITDKILFIDLIFIRTKSNVFIYSYVSLNSAKNKIKIHIFGKDNDRDKIVVIPISNKRINTFIMDNIQQMQFTILHYEEGGWIYICFTTNSSVSLFFVFLLSDFYSDLIKPKGDNIQFMVLSNYYNGINDVKNVSMKIDNKGFMTRLQTRNQESLVSIFNLNLSAYQVNYDFSSEKAHLSMDILTSGQIFMLNQINNLTINLDEFSSISIFPYYQRLFPNEIILNFVFNDIKYVSNMIIREQGGNLITLQLIFQNKIKFLYVFKEKQIIIQKVPFRSKTMKLKVSNEFHSNHVEIDLDDYKIKLGEHMMRFGNFYLFGLIIISFLFGFIYPLLRER